MRLLKTIMAPEEVDGKEEEAWHRKVDAEKESKSVAKVGERRSHRTWCEGDGVVVMFGGSGRFLSYVVEVEICKSSTESKASTFAYM